MSTNLTDPIFHDDEAARDHLQALRWRNGPICAHCGAVEGMTQLQGKSHRPGLFQCNQCREHFTVTVGTVIERSPIALCKWVLGFHLMAASKQGMSAALLSRMLSVTYKSAWFMAHRIRAAMTDPNRTPLGGEGQIVEADEMYQGKREMLVPSPNRRGRPYLKRRKYNERRAVIGLTERGGAAIAIHLKGRVT